MNIGHENFLLCNFLEFVGDGIGMPMFPGNKFFENSGCSKFSCTENSWEMLDQVDCGIFSGAGSLSSSTSTSSHSA